MSVGQNGNEACVAVQRLTTTTTHYCFSESSTIGGRSVITKSGNKHGLVVRSQLPESTRAIDRWCGTMRARLCRRGISQIIGQPNRSCFVRNTLLASLGSNAEGGRAAKRERQSGAERKVKAKEILALTHDTTRYRNCSPINRPSFLRTRVRRRIARVHEKESREKKGDQVGERASE